MLNLDFNLYLKNCVSTTMVVSSRQPAEIFSIINSLNHNKFCGNDISSHFLRIGAKILACFELALELGIFPQVLPTA